MKILVGLLSFALFVTLSCKTALACDRTGVPEHAVDAQGKIMIDVLFKNGTQIEEAQEWLSKFGEAKRSSRRVPGFRVKIQCLEQAREIEKSPSVQAMSFAPPAPSTFPGVTIR